MDWEGHKYQFGRAVADREDVGKRSIFDCGTEITHLTFNNDCFVHLHALIQMSFCFPLCRLVIITNLTFI